uniref:FH2 domain-containing protein n=1 Tax=Heterorhabditis bacteriophora TaxID=37862 RepID=A0A1I7WYN8_HETBA
MSTNQDRKISCQVLLFTVIYIYIYIHIYTYPQKHDSLESVDNGVSSSGSTDDMRNNHPRECLVDKIGLFHILYFLLIMFMLGVRSTSSWSLVMLPQPSRPTENQPRYLVRNIGNFVLDDQQTKDTIFDGIPNELEADDHMSNESRLEYPLLTEEQHQLVSDVIKEIHLKKFEVEFSIHRMDLKVLPLERAALVLSVTPSATDVSRIKNFVENHPDFKWTEEEQFIIDVCLLAKIERAEEKLKVMIHNATFDDEIQKINTELDNFSSAAKAVQSSENFRSILELVRILLPIIFLSKLVCLNLFFFYFVHMYLVPFLDIFSSIGRLIDGNNRMQRELELLSFDHDQLTQRLLADCRQVEETMDKLMRVKTNFINIHIYLLM